MKRVSRDPCRCYKDQFFGVNFSGIHNNKKQKKKHKKTSNKQKHNSRSKWLDIGSWVDGDGVFCFRILYHEQQPSGVKSSAFGSFLSEDMKVKISF